MIGCCVCSLLYKLKYMFLCPFFKKNAAFSVGAVVVYYALSGEY